MIPTFNRILSHLPDLIIGVHQSLICYHNQVVEKQLGYPLDSLIGQPFSDLVLPEEKQLLDNLFAQLRVEKELSASLKIHLRHREGTWLFYEINCQSVPDETGFLYLIMTGRNLTEQEKQNLLLQQHARLSHLAAEIGIALGKSRTLGEILEHCTQAMVQHLEITFAGIWILNRATRLLELEAFAGEQPATAEFADRIPFGISMVGFVAQYLKPYISQIQTDEIAESESTNVPHDVIAVAGYPLIVENNLVGVLAFCSCQLITEDIRELLGWVVNAIAIAIDRTRHSANREALLFRLTQQIRNSLDLNTILQTAVQEILSFLQLDRCLFLWYRDFPHPETISETKGLPNESYWEVVQEAKNKNLPSLIGRYPTRATGNFTDQLLNAEMIKLDRINTLEESTMRQFLLEAGFFSMLALPLKTISGQIGVISCGISSKNTPQQNRYWKETEIQLLTAVTDQLAIAIDQAELYSQSQKSAEIAQARAAELAEILHQLKTTQSQLIQTEKMSTVGQMVAGIAHEINNPLSFILGNLSYIREYNHDLLELFALYQESEITLNSKIQQKYEETDFEFIAQDLPKLLESIESGSRRIYQIVKSLKNFSRLDESGTKAVDLHEGLDNTLLLLQHRLKPLGKKCGIQVIKNYGNLPLVECYAGQINQVFMNLLSNAIEALESRSEPCLIKITTALIVPEHTKNPALINIIIADNGLGMSEEIKKRAFDPFFTTKPVGTGTGLGLSIAHHIVVEKHGGSLNCTSQLGQGTEFSIKIPIQFMGR